MYSILSDSGSWVVVFDGDEEEPMEMTVQEFIDRYGEENLPEFPSREGFVICPDVEKVFDADNLAHYYCALERFVKACGNKTVRLQRVEAENYRTWCRWMNLEPMPRSEVDGMVQRLYDRNLRRRIYYRIKKYCGLGELRSLTEILQEIERTYP